ncbi:MAG: patatin-like phospholipase family protein [bacterium]|nr:patatin-like phospholipase family protein [bacterium]
MHRIGLALSGGGFRATIYHLGVLRFLRDAGVLPHVSHITSVSGGSITAAHAVLNWDRYSGTEEQFDEAAEELLDFIRLDLRNRIVRRFPMAFLANSVRGLVGLGKLRQLTRPGLLEVQYRKYLYGDKCLYELPDAPQLHMLATNINEGCICSFTKTGLLDQIRLPNGETQFESVASAMATVPMGVTASSAFPGFFPPLKLTAADVGADEGRFPPHVFTDGGVYDNLGVRMFRHIRDTWIGEETPLRAVDFVDAEAAANELNAALKRDSNSDVARRPLNALARLVLDRIRIDSPYQDRIQPQHLAEYLWKVIVYDCLYSDPQFQVLGDDSPRFQELMLQAQHVTRLGRGDHHWLNRVLADQSFVAATGQHLLRSTRIEFDAVIVSDAGKEFHISRQTKGGGLVGTALRASDILMDRVWKLEVDHFESDAGFLFVPISHQVALAEDSKALHPEMQRQVATIRTDLDRFSDLEISGLIRHGYGLMRKVCRSRPDLFGSDLPDGEPWDPTAVASKGKGHALRGASYVTEQARQLQSSSQRKIVTTLFDWRDWPTYIYIPLLLLLLVGLPALAWNTYKRASRSAMIIDAITLSNPDWQLVLDLARQKPVPGEWLPLKPTEVAELSPVDSQGFRLITDTRILDLRGNIGKNSNDRAVIYRRMKVRRLQPSDSQLAPSSKFKFQQYARTNDIVVRCDANNLLPAFRIAPYSNGGQIFGFLCEGEFDLSGVPFGQVMDIGFEVAETGVQGREDIDQRIEFAIVAPTDVATMWVLLPSGKPYRDFQLVEFDSRAKIGIETIEPTYQFDMSDGSLFGWMLVAPKENAIYECRWSWRE